MKDKTLDTLFKDAFSTSQLSEEDNWDAFSIRLQKKMFYRFSWNRFNIYYLVLVGLSVLINIAFLFHILRTSSVSATAQSVNKQNDSITLNHLPIEGQEGKSTKQTSLPSNDNSSVIRKTNLLLPSQQDSASAAITAADTLTIPKATTEVAVVSEKPKQQVVLKREKKIYITKRDTIINIDTLTVKKGKKNNL